MQPDRPDEKARIEAVGGRVVYLNGPRVRGILAMSRALGNVIVIIIDLNSVCRHYLCVLCLLLCCRRTKIACVLGYNVLAASCTHDSLKTT